MTDILSYKETQRVVNESYSEADFQENVVAEAERQGWRVYHVEKVLVTKGSKQYWITPVTEPDFPDLHLLRGGRIIYAELKRQKGYPTKGQKEYLGMLSAVAFVAHGAIGVYVWRPSDMDDIIEILK